MTGAERTGDNNGSTRCVLLLRRCRPCLCGNGTLRFTSGGGGEKRKVIAGLYVHGPRLIALMTFTRRTAPDAMLQQSFRTWSLLPLQSEAKLYMSLLKGSDSE